MANGQSRSGTGTQLQEREKRLKAEMKPFEAADYHYRTLDH
ncbi:MULTISPECIES: hypothetical protein [unclassified Cohnella]|nr:MULTISPECIES: hypothetical protein [unclassified Cohnella]